MKKPIIPLKLPFGAGGFPSLFPLRGLGGFLVAWLAVLLVACHKDKEPEPSLPPETQTGANTFGCMLNGEVWTNSQRQSFSPATLEAVPEVGGILSIRAFNKNDGKNEMISLYSQKIEKEGTYILNNITSARVVDYNKNINCASYDGDVTYKGEITITRFDLSNRIISGRFFFKLQKQDGLIFEATEGRFDLQMN